MNDLIERLRDYSPENRQHIVHEAADEIERLTRERDEARDGFRESMNDHAETLRKLDEAWVALRRHGIHVMSKDCWCNPTVENNA